MSTIKNAQTFDTPPILSLANAVVATLPITANVIPGTTITYTGTLPVGAIFGELSYVNYMNSTGISSPKLRFVFDYPVCPDLQTITFTGIDSVMMATANTDSLLTSISVPDATQFTLVGNFVNLTTLSCPNVVQFSGAGLSTFSSTGTNNLNRFSVLTTLSMPNVEYLLSTFNPVMPLLTTFSMPKLKSIGGVGNTSFNPNMAILTTLSFPALTYVTVFNPTAPLLTSLSLPVLQTINEVINTALSLALPALTSFSLPALTSVKGGVSVTLNACTSFSMPLVTSMGYAAQTTLFSLPLVTTLSFPSLVTVVGALTLTCAAVTTLTLPVLATIGGNATIICAVLTTLSLPALVNTAVIAITAANMTTFSMGATLKSVAGNFTLNNAKLNQASVDGILASLASLDGTNGTTAYSTRTVLINGGTNATPSAAGLTSKATLVARGCTVTNN